MATRQYIGARYVPILMGEWQADTTYEALSIVTYNYGSYTSKKPVPANVIPTNTEYWVLTGNYNGQVEAYRQDVLGYKGDAETAINGLDGRLDTAEGDIDSLETTVSQNFNTLSTNINGVNSTLTAAVGAVANDLSGVEDTVTNNERRTETWNGKRVLLVGDSFARGQNADGGGGPTEDSWCKYFINRSQCNATILTTSGGGFINSGGNGTFGDILTAKYNEWYNNESTRHILQEIKAVVCGGGYNDYVEATVNDTFNYSNLYSAVQTFIDNARRYFPNAIVVVAPLYTDYVMIPARYNTFKTIYDAAIRKGAIASMGLIDILMEGNTDFDSGDHVHPNVQGEAILGSALFSLLCGGNIEGPGYSNAEAVALNTTNVTNTYFNLIRHGRIANLSCSVNLKAAASSELEICTIRDVRYRPGHNTAMFFPIVWHETVHNRGVGILTINANGSVTVTGAGVTIPSGARIVANICYPCYWKNIDGYNDLG